MPPTSTPPFQPQPSNTDHLSKTLWIAVGAVIILAVIVVSLYAATPRASGSVTFLVRGDDGTRTVQTFSLSTHALTKRDGVDPNTTSEAAKTAVLTDGSIVTLDPAGVIKLVGGVKGPVSLLIASPVVVPQNTPLSVWGDGAKIAWRSPVDASVQVFYRSERGAYIPVYLNKDIHPSSIGFTADGAFLMVTTNTKDKTNVYSIGIESGQITNISSLSGIASIVPTP